MLTETIHHQDTKDFNDATDVFRVGDEVHVLTTGMQFMVVMVTKKSIQGCYSNNPHSFRDLLDRDIELTRDGQTVLFKMEAIVSPKFLYRWTRYEKDA